MSLVIAFIGMQGAVMASGYPGDYHQRGYRSRQKPLNRSSTADRLLPMKRSVKRAGELGISLAIRDDKRKVTQRDGVLVGEVMRNRRGCLQEKKTLCNSRGVCTCRDNRWLDLRLTGKGTGQQLRGPGKPGYQTDCPYHALRNTGKTALCMMQSK